MNFNQLTLNLLQKARLRKRPKQAAVFCNPARSAPENAPLIAFPGKPEFAKKTRGEQYFFVNKRYIRHPYLHHAVQNAYEELIQDGQFPSYFINFDIDPQKIDVNIHPTKTEINFCLDTSKIPLSEILISGMTRRERNERERIASLLHPSCCA